MKSVRILINSFAKARRFHHVIAQFDGEFDLLQDRYVINATRDLVYLQPGYQSSHSS